MKTLIKYLDLRPHEVQRVFLTALVFFLVQVDDGIIKSVSQAVFNVRIGVEKLPTMYTWISILFSISMVMLSWITGIIARERLLYFLIAGIGVTLATNTMFLISEKVGFLSLPDSFYSFLFVSSELVRTILNFQIWIVAGGICFVSRAKVFFPILAACAVLGDIAGGTFVRLSSSALEAFELYAVATANIVVIFFLLRLCMRRFFVVTEETINAKSSLSENIRYILGSNYLLLLFGISLAIFAVYTTVHYGFNVVSVSYFQSAADSEEKITNFLGLFFASTGIATLIGTFFVLPPLFKWLGTRKIYFCVGVTYLFIATMLLGVFSTNFVDSSIFASVSDPLFWPLVAIFSGNLVSYLLLDSVVAPTYQVLVQLIPERNTDGTRMIMEGGFFLLGGLAGAGITALHAQNVLDLRDLFILLLFVGIALAVSGYILKGVYTRQLTNAVRNQNIDVTKEDLSQSITSMMSQDNDFFKGLLTHPADGVRDLGIQLARKHPSPQLEPVLIELFRDENPRIRSGAIRAYTPTHEPQQVINSLIDSLDDEDFDVQLQALNAILNCLMTFDLVGNAKNDILNAILPMWRSEDNLPARTGVVLGALELLGHQNTHAERQKRLWRLLTSENIDELIAGINASKYFNSEDVKNRQISWLHHQDAQVREAAVIAVAARGETIDLLALVDHIGDPDPDVTAAVIEVLENFQTGPVKEKMLDELSTCPLRSWERLIIALTTYPDEITYKSIIKSAISRLRVANRYLICASEIRKEQGVDILLDQIDLQVDLTMSGVVRFLVSVAEANVINDLLERLAADDEAQRETAIELIGNIADPIVLRLLLPLLEKDVEVKTTLALQVSDSIPGDSITAISHLMEEPDIWTQKAAVWAAFAINRPEIALESNITAQPEIANFVSDLVEGERSMTETTQPMSTFEKIAFLKQSDFFETLPLEELMEIASTTKEEFHHPEDPVVVENTTGDKMYFVVRGELRVVVGDNQQVAVLKESQAFGEQALLEEDVRSASVIASEEVHLLSLDRESLHRILRRHSSIALAMLRVLSNRLRSAQQN